MEQGELKALHCGQQAGYQFQAIYDTGLTLPKKECGHAGDAVRTYAYCKEAGQCQGAH